MTVVPCKPFCTEKSVIVSSGLLDLSISVSFARTLINTLPSSSIVAASAMATGASFTAVALMNTLAVAVPP